MTEKEGIAYRTSGGGLAKRNSDGKMVFIEAPDESFNLHIGEEVPEFWRIFPENDPVKK